MVMVMMMEDWIWTGRWMRRRWLEGLDWTVRHSTVRRYPLHWSWHQAILLATPGQANRALRWSRGLALTAPAFSFAFSFDLLAAAFIFALEGL